MTAMIMTYDALDDSELRGDTRADRLVSIDGHLTILDGADRVLDEPSFPVVELAWSLQRWLNEPRRADFEFDSMSFEELGTVTVRESPTGWVFGSVLAPDSASAPVAWPEAERCIRAFVAKVAEDLRALGIDPGATLA